MEHILLAESYILNFIEIVLKFTLGVNKAYANRKQLAYQSDVSSSINSLRTDLERQIGEVAAGGDVDLSGYYTSSQVDSLLSGKANTNHTHSTSQISGLQSYVENIIEQSSSSSSGSSNAEIVEICYVWDASDWYTRYNGQTVTILTFDKEYQIIFLRYGFVGYSAVGYSGHPIRINNIKETIELDSKHSSGYTWGTITVEYDQSNNALIGTIGGNSCIFSSNSFIVMDCIELI